MSRSDRDRDIPPDRAGSSRDRIEDEDHMTLSEEELEVRRQRYRAGEVDVRKHAETEHVRREVPVSHEEVTIERHRMEPGAAVPERFGEIEEIRVPVEREEVTTEKRVVPKEEVVVRKHPVQEERMVEADLLRERADVEGDARGLDDEEERRR